MKDTILYDGFLKLVKRTIGDMEREIVVQDGAAAIMLMNKDKSKMLLVRQLRAAAGAYTWEIPAGMMDVPGETLEDCIIRELEEEAHIKLKVKDLKYENSFMPNIGTSTHKLSIYSAITDETDGAFMDDDDVVEARWFTEDEMSTMIDVGHIIDGKTLIAFYKMFNSKY